MNILQEVMASDPIHLKATKTSTPITLRTMNISQGMMTGSKIGYDQPSTSKGKEPAHPGPTHVHPSLFRQFASVGPELTAQMATSMEDFE